MAIKTNLKQEARLFAVYLVGRQPSTDVVRRYQTAIAHTQPPVSKRDERLLQFVRQHPRALGLIDAGLAARQPYSEVRRRLYVMLAILEATPQYATAFLPQRRSPLYFFFIAYTCCRSVVKASTGLLLLGAIR